MLSYYKPWLLISNSHQAVWMISKTHPPTRNVSQTKMDLVNKQIFLVVFAFLFVFASGFFLFCFCFLHNTSPSFFFSVSPTTGNGDQTHEQTSQIIQQPEEVIKEMGVFYFVFVFSPFSIVWALTGKLWKKTIVLRATEGLHVCFCSSLAFSSLRGPI